MKIRSVTISNSLSFALQAGTLTPNIGFRTGTNLGSCHILIGPNGAGKSNFIEIINHCFRKALFQPAQLNESLLMSKGRGDFVPAEQLRQTLTMPNPATDWSLRSHDDSGSETQTIILMLELNDNDFANLEFLLDNAERINEVLSTYSPTGIVIPTSPLMNLRTHHQIGITLEYVRTNNQLTINLASGGDLNVAFIETYLRKFQAFQMVITIYNRYIKAPADKPWRELQQTFAMLGSYRNYAAIGSGIVIDANRSFQNVFDRLKAESTRSGGGDEPAVFEMVKKKIGYEFLELFDEASREEALTKLYSTEPLASINRLTSKYLNLTIKVRRLNKYDLSMEMFFERGGKRIDTTDLSSGEKGILHFIFTLYGFDLQNGVVVIDEPELHLHPQIQREYQAIISDVLSKLDIQFIIATHSPIFVGVDSIEDVYRLYKRSGSTNIINPAISAPQKALTKILDLTNSAKIFFVRKALLVEGETDEYFLRFVLDYLKAHANEPGAPTWYSKIEDFEIFNIKGKGARAIWTDFLRAFGLEVSFLGDWDSISEVATFDLSQYTTQYQQSLAVAGKAIAGKGSNDGAALLQAVDKVLADQSALNLQELSSLKDYILLRTTDYPALIQHIKTTDGAEWTRLEHAINDARAQNILILKHGELENYLGVQGKGIDRVIEFCENTFPSWLMDPSVAVFKNDLFESLEQIFS